MSTTLAVAAEPARVATRGPARRPGAPARGDAGPRVAVVVRASLLVGSPDRPPGALLRPRHPLHAVARGPLDRTLLALAVGAALGLAGACMQGLTRNPLADPGILGINAGASFAMVLAISFFGVSDLHGYVWFAFAGRRRGRRAGARASPRLGRDGATPVKLAIAGAALTAAVTSWTSGVLLDRPPDAWRASASGRSAPSAAATSTSC